MVGSRFELTAGATALVDLGVPAGREAGFARPVVVVTAQEILDGNPSVVQVVPITSKLRKYWTDVPIDPGQSGLSVMSQAQCQHLRSLSVGRINEIVGKVSTVELRQLREVIALLMDLGAP